MSTIIQKQYETAKQILSAVEMNFRSYEICGRTQKDFDYFYDIATSLLTIVGNVHIGTKVCQAQRENGVSIIDECRQMFAAYEAELMQAGLIPSKWSRSSQMSNQLNHRKQSSIARSRKPKCGMST